MQTSIMSTLWQYGYQIAQKKISFSQSMVDCVDLIKSYVESRYWENMKIKNEITPPTDISCPLFAWVRLAQRLEDKLFHVSEQGSLIREQMQEVHHAFVGRKGNRFILDHKNIQMIDEPPGLMQAVMYAQMTNQPDLHINILREWSISLKLVNRNSLAIKYAASACEGFKDQMEVAIKRNHHQAKESYQYWGLDTAKKFKLKDYIECFKNIENDEKYLDEASAEQKCGQLLDEGLQLHCQYKNEEALLLFQEALEIVQHFQNTYWGCFGMAAANYDIGNCYSQLRDYNSSLWHYELALSQFKQIGAMDVYCEVLFNLGGLYAKTLQMDKTKETWEQCVELGEQHNPGQASKALIHLERLKL